MPGKVLLRLCPADPAPCAYVLMYTLCSRWRFFRRHLSRYAGASIAKGVLRSMAFVALHVSRTWRVPSHPLLPGTLQQVPISRQEKKLPLSW